MPVTPDPLTAVLLLVALLAVLGVGLDGWRCRP